MTLFGLEPTMAIVWLGLLLLAIVASAFFSGAETGIYAVNRLRLELRAEDPRRPRARYLQRFLENRELALCVLLLGNNIANETAAMVAERLAIHWVAGPQAVILTTAVLTPITFVLAEALPKQVFRQHAETLTYRSAPLLVAVRWLLWPLAVLVLPIARAASQWAARRHRELRGLRHDEYALERLLVAGGSSVASVRDTALTVGSIRTTAITAAMVPFDRTEWLEASCGIDDLRERLRRAAHSRYPLRGADGSFSGYVYFLDPFQKYARGKVLQDFSRPLVRLRPDCPLDEALSRLEADGARVGVVGQEEGAPQGFVFAGDLVRCLLAMDNGRIP